MQSKASYYKGHPLHPMLIPFPIAFLVGALLFDLAGFVLGMRALWATAYYLVPAGIFFGLVAAVPGFIDFIYTVPPQSSAKGRALRHMLVNVTALALFAIAWWVRGPSLMAPETGVMVLEFAGVAFLTAGGWLGSTLVYRNQIGVDHRYARAGKWNEVSVAQETGRAIPVARSDELETDQMKLVRVDGRRIVLARTEEGYVAFDDRCTHSGGSLAGGAMMCGRVQCPWHGSQFDVATGEVVAGPATQPIATYRVEESAGEVRLLLDQPGAGAAEPGEEPRRRIA
jgi:nitrite reductase/ring-hydroxylating ferredoxin subunit/uncharacterized membrane protein